MTVRRPPIQSIDKKTEEFISQGGGTAAKAEVASKAEATVNVRLPVDVLAQVDEIVKRRRARIPRHSWLLEAIFEKLDREHSAVNP
jgi:hypothetical protein